MEEITKMIPLLLISGRELSYITLLVPLIYMLPTIYTKIMSYINKSDRWLVIYKCNKIRWWEENISYIHLDSYIEQSKYNETVTRASENFVITDTIPNTRIYTGYISTSPESVNIDVQWEGHKINIKKHAEQLEVKDNRPPIQLSYMLKSKSHEALDGFMKHCQELYIEDQKKKNQTQYKIYHYANKQWSHSSINTVKTFDNIILDPAVHVEISNVINLLNTKRFQDINGKLGLANKVSFLIHGEPGCGKSSVILATSKITNMPIYCIPSIDSVGADELKILLNLIPDNVIITLEDADCCKDLHERSLDDSSECSDTSSTGGSAILGVEKLKGSSFSKLKIMLEYLDGYYSMKDSIFFMTANHVEKLDKALIRPGRIDFNYHFTKPSYDDIVKFTTKINIPTPAAPLQGGNLEISEVLNEARLKYIAENIHAK